MGLTLRLSPQGPGEAFAPIRSVGDDPVGVLGAVIAPTEEDEHGYFVVDGSVGIMQKAVHSVAAGERPETCTPVDFDDVLDALDARAAFHLWTGICSGLGPMVARAAITGDLLPLDAALEFLHRLRDGYAERGILAGGDEEREHE
jgi:hypothetical protein